MTEEKKNLLQQVIAANRALQMRSRDLNSRAGQILFPVMTKSEWENWLRDKLAGAVSAATIPDIATLTLPPLDEAVVAEVLQGNPDTIQIDGREYTVVYTGHYSACPAKIKVEPETLKEWTTVPVLPSGRTITLVCTYEGKTFELISLSELKQKIEQRRIEKAWEVARSTHEHDSWIREPQVVLPHLLRVGQEIVVTHDHDGQPVTGFLSLYSDSDPDFKIKLRATREEMRDETALGLQRLVQKTLKAELVVPQEEPFQVCNSGSWPSSWQLTEAGQALKAKLGQLVVDLNGLTPENVADRIQQIREQAQTFRLEVGGRYATVQTIIAKAGDSINTTVNDLVSDRYLVQTEVEAVQTLINQAREYLKTLAYDEAELVCLEAEEMAGRLSALASTRSQYREAAEAAKAAVFENLESIAYRYNAYAASNDTEASQAQQLRDAILGRISDYQFEIVITKAEEAEALIAAVDQRLAKIQESLAVLEQHLAQHYAKTAFLEIERPQVDMYLSLGYDHELFDALYEVHKESLVGDPCLRLIESRLNGQAVAWLALEYADRNEASLSIRTNRDIPVSESDLEKIEVVQLWQPPHGKEVELRKQIRTLKARIDHLEREQNRSGRLTLTFQPDQRAGHQSKLFAFGVLEYLRAKKPGSEEYQVLENVEIRFVCDPARCQWLDTPPRAEETWVITHKDFMIGWDKQNRPIIRANPQVRVENRAELEKRITALEAELGALRSKSQAATQSSAPVASEAPAQPGPSLSDLANMWGARLKK